MLVTGSYVEDQPSVMNIRDEFAKAAMQAILTAQWPEMVPREGAFDDIARIAYDMAEAMMEQREKRP